MHRLFVSEGVVLGKRSVGEANALLWLLTRDMGLVRASARSSRAEQSKLRFGLEPLTRGVFTFVRGRYEWKLVGAENASREFVSPHALRRRAAGRISKLLMRLISGEEPAAPVYATVAEGLRALAVEQSDAEAEAVECILVLRILSELGYVQSSSELLPFLERALFSAELIASASGKRPFLIRTINDSLSASGL